MQADLISKAILTRFDQVTHYHIGISTNIDLPTISKDIILVIDCSGSMAGQCMNDTKKTLMKLIDFILTTDFSSVSLIKFNSVPTVIPRIPKNAQELKKHVDSIKAEGGTCFIKALDAIKTTIESFGQKIPFLSLIFMTDGQSDEKLQDSIATLNKKITLLATKSEVHTLGMGRDHNPVLLENITKIGSGEGTYQYISNNEEIDPCFANIIKYFENSVPLKASLFSKSKAFPLAELSLQPFENNLFKYNFEGSGFLEIPIQGIKENDLAVLVKKKNFEEVFLPQIEKKLELDRRSYCKLVFEYLKIQFIKISTELTNQINNIVKNIKVYETIHTNFVALKAKFHQEVQKSFKLPIEERHQLMESTINPLNQDYIQKIELLINAGFKNNITNELIANVQALSYKDKFSSSIQKSVAKRAPIAVKILNNAYAEVEKFCLTLNREVLEKKYESLIQEFGNCALTVNNFVEALMEKDCFCLTFNVTCNDFCTVNSNEIVINEIFPTYVTANSFLESVKFKLKINGGGPAAIGGFDENPSEKIIKGAAAENINACLPIFICDEHWMVARHLMKPIIGWVLTMDPAGYCEAQRKILPFILLRKCMEDHFENKEKVYPKKVFERVLETCRSVMREGETEDDKSLEIEISEMYRDYIKDGEIRCEKVTSNSVFLLQIYVAFKNGALTEKDMEEFPRIFNKVCEDEMRRQIDSMDEVVMGNKIQTLMNITQAKIYSFGQKITSEIKEKEIIETKKKNGEDVKEEEEKKGPSVLEEKLMKTEEICMVNGLSEIQKEFYNSQLKTLKEKCGILFEIRKLFNFPELELNFASIGIDTDVKFLCFALQNITQNKIHVRRDAIKNLKYKNAENHEECIEFLESLATKTIQEQSDRIIKWKFTQFQVTKINLPGKPIKPYKQGKGRTRHKKNYEHDLDKFIQANKSGLNNLIKTKNLDEAMNILKSLGEHRKYYMDYFLNHGGNLLMEKILMIMVGSLNGVVFCGKWADHFFVKPDIVQGLIASNKITNDEWEFILQKKREQRKNYKFH